MVPGAAQHDQALHRRCEAALPDQIRPVLPSECRTALITVVKTGNIDVRNISILNFLKAILNGETNHNGAAIIQLIGKDSKL